MAVPTRHGIVIVHGQVGELQPGEQLALVANGIADTLENAGGTVEREFHVAGDQSTGLLRVTKPGALEPGDEFRFIEAYWAKALPDAPADVVAKWMLRRGPAEALTVILGFWMNAANDELGDGTKSDHRAGLWLRLVFTVELALLTPIIWLIAAASVVLAPVAYAIYSLAGGLKRSQATGVFAPLARALHALDPFLSSTMGDTWRVVEDGMWAVNIRGAVERPLLTFYADPSITDITIIAHSAGCGVAYDALLEGRPVADAAAVTSPTKRLTLVTVGSAVNRDHDLSRSSDTSPFARRFYEVPLDARITGVPSPKTGPLVAASTPAAVRALQDRFYWVDLFARMDLVPGGGLSPASFATARIDPCQLKRRQVMNEDSLLHDHFTYFNNQDLVIPRLIRAIYGGEYPWDGTQVHDTPKITPDRITHRTRGVAALQAIRLLLAGIIAAYVVFYFVSDAFRQWAARDAGAIINVDLGAFGEFITLAAVLVGPILLAYYLYGFIRGWFFDDL